MGAILDVSRHKSKPEAGDDEINHWEDTRPWKEAWWDELPEESVNNDTATTAAAGERGNEGQVTSPKSIVLLPPYWSSKPGQTVEKVATLASGRSESKGDGPEAKIDIPKVKSNMPRAKTESVKDNRPRQNGQGRLFDFSNDEKAPTMKVERRQPWTKNGRRQQVASVDGSTWKRPQGAVAALEGNNNTNDFRCFIREPVKCELAPKFAACPLLSCCPCQCSVDNCKVTLQTVQKLVDAENKDVELSELLGGSTTLDEPEKKIINKYDATTSKSNRDDSENNVDPQYLGYLMKLIENGLNTKTDPNEVYEHLFSKGNADASFVKLGPSAAISNKDVVIPMSASTVINAMDSKMENGARLASIVPRSNVVVTEATGDIDDLDDLHVLLGDKGPLPITDMSEDNGRPRDTLLETRAPVQSTAVLRGSTAPAWFPGFNVALPDTALPAVITDPEAVLDKAWFHSQPLSLELDNKSAKLIGS